MFATLSGIAFLTILFVHLILLHQLKKYLWWNWNHKMMAFFYFILKSINYSSYCCSWHCLNKNYYWNLILSLQKSKKLLYQCSIKMEHLQLTEISQDIILLRSTKKSRAGFLKVQCNGFVLLDDGELSLKLSIQNLLILHKQTWWDY